MPTTFDTAVVLGARVRPDGGASPALARRVAHAVALHHAGLARRLLLTGGRTRGNVAEAEAMRDLALAAGVTETALLIEDQARNTVENALFALRLLRPPPMPLLVVTDRFHLPRALLVFRRLGVIAVGSAPPPRSQWSHYRGLASEAAALPLTLWRLERLRHRA